MPAENWNPFEMQRNAPDMMHEVQFNYLNRKGLVPTAALRVVYVV